MEKQDLTLLIGIIVGATVGALVTLLVVPRSGQETREQLAERGLELKDRAEDVVEHAQQVANETVMKVQTAAHELVEGKLPTDLKGGSTSA